MTCLWIDLFCQSRTLKLYLFELVLRSLAGHSAKSDTLSATKWAAGNELNARLALQTANEKRQHVTDLTSQADEMARA
jgi:hypothetical protein